MSMSWPGRGGREDPVVEILLGGRQEMRLESKREDLTEGLLGHVKDDGKPLKGDVCTSLSF